MPKQWGQKKQVYNHLSQVRSLWLLTSLLLSCPPQRGQKPQRVSAPASGTFQMSQFFASGGPSIGASGLISFRIDWLDLLAVQETLKRLIQHHSSKASIFWCSAFFMVQLSHPYMTTGKTIALTRWIFVGKVMSLLFSMLSKLVVTFLPRSKCLLISWLQLFCSDSGDQKNKVCDCFHHFPIYFPWSHGTEYHDLSSLNIEL